MNYLKEYYQSSANRNESRYEMIKKLTEGTEAERKAVFEINKLQRQIQEKQDALSKIVEDNLFEGFVKAFDKANLTYCDRSGETAMFELETGIPTDRRADRIIELGKMNTVLWLVGGYHFETATIIVNKYNIGVKPNKSAASVRFEGAVLLDFIGRTTKWFDAKTKTLSDHIPEDRDNPFTSGLDYEDKTFINTLFSCDYQGRKTLGRLYECEAWNKSFEIILKTCPVDIVDRMLEQKFALALPMQKLMRLEPAVYETAKAEGLLPYFLDIDEWRDKLKMTDSELLEYLRNTKRYQEELDFYTVDYTMYNCNNLADSICCQYFKSARYGKQPLFFKYYSLNKFQEYVCTETVNQGYGAVRDFVGELFDYLDMCEQQKINPTLYSSYLRQTHDVCMRNHKIIVEKNKEQIFKERYEGFQKWKKGKYMVVAPKCTNDLVREGDNLNHCVASYIKRVIDDTCKIFFLRTEEDKSLITFEVNGDRIVQVRGAHNRRPNESEVAALENYCKDRNMSYYA